MEVKWTAKTEQRKSWVFEIEQETVLELPANREKVRYRLSAYDRDNSDDVDFLYDKFEDAQAHAEEEWGVPLDSWVQANE